MWSAGGLPTLKRYLAFNVAQLVPYYEKLGAPVSLPTDAAAIVADVLAPDAAIRFTARS